MSAAALLPIKPPVLTISSFSDCITHCITSSRCTTKKKPGSATSRNRGFILSGGQRFEPATPSLGSTGEGSPRLAPRAFGHEQMRQPTSASPHKLPHAFPGGGGEPLLAVHTSNGGSPRPSRSLRR